MLHATTAFTPPVTRVVSQEELQYTTENIVNVPSIPMELGLESELHEVLQEPEQAESEEDLYIAADIENNGELDSLLASPASPGSSESVKEVLLTIERWRIASNISNRAFDGFLQILPKLITGCILPQTWFKWKALVWY